ncbi:MAG: hypothetical protein ABGX23_00690 [Nautiliaceae bacterium]
MIFLFSDYERFCEDLADSGIFSLSAKEVIDKNPKKFLILKHDIEAKPKNALKIAKIEAKFGHKASYYVHFDILKSNLELFKEIQNLGHEVSYHYDVLDSNRGDFKKAKEEFDKNIAFFEKNGFKIKSVCQHGNPLIKRNGYTSNRDFFRKFGSEYKFRDIVVNFKEEVGDFIYISDVGYQWQIIPSPHTADINPQKTIKTSYEEMLNLAKKNSLIISSHPHRYFNTKVEAYFKHGVFNIIKNIAKIFYKTPLGKKILSKFYYLAKRF